MSIYENSIKSQEEIDEHRSQKLHDIYVELRKENKRKSIKLKNDLHIVKASKEIESTLNTLKRKLEQQKVKWNKWKTEYENFDWWNKLECIGGPDYSEIETQIVELDKMNDNFKVAFQMLYFYRSLPLIRSGQYLQARKNIFKSVKVKYRYIIYYLILFFPVNRTWLLKLMM